MRRGRLILACLAGLAVVLGSGVARPAAEDVSTCPVDGKVFPAAQAARVVGVGDERVRLCSGACLQTFIASPEAFLSGTYLCPVLTDRRSKADRQMRRVVNNDLYYLC